MNNAKMWLVVKPTTGVPIFLSAVAIGSFAVHVAVLSNTGWVSDFLKGQPLGSSQQTAMIIDDQDRNAIKPAVFDERVAGDRIVVTLPDGRIAVAVIQEDHTLAHAAGGPSTTD